jgi:hypothetical protein
MHNNGLVTLARTAIKQHGALQDEIEFAFLMDHVVRVQPRAMIEIGSHNGGSLWAWRQIVPTCHIIAVTLDGSQVKPHGASIINDDSTHPETHDRIRRLLSSSGETDCLDFVFIDGGHDEFTARADMEFALSLLEGSRKDRHLKLIGLHDVNLFMRYPELVGPRLVLDQYRRRLPTIEFSNKCDEDPGVALFWIQ